MNYERRKGILPPLVSSNLPISPNIITFNPAAPARTQKRIYEDVENEDNTLDQNPKKKSRKTKQVDANSRTERISYVLHCFYSHLGNEKKKWKEQQQARLAAASVVSTTITATQELDDISEPTLDQSTFEGMGVNLDDIDDDFKPFGLGGLN